MAEEESQSMANARDTLDLVLAAQLRLAQRAVDHIEGHAGDGVKHVTLEDTLDAGGYEWKLHAQYREGFAFVRIYGAPQPAGGGITIATSVEELAEAMGAQSAAYDTQIPRAWIAAAIRDAERVLS
jgi:hypothetical protein